MRKTNYKDKVIHATLILRPNLTYKSCLVFLLCAYCLFVVTGTPNIVYRLVGAVIFSGASIAVFYKFHWVKYFFYAWAFISLLGVTLIGHFFECYTLREGVAILWLVAILSNALPSYALGRLINRIEPKNLTENWIDVLAIAAFISILCVSYSQNFAGHLNDFFHFIPSIETIYERAEENPNWESTYAKLGLFLWPKWLLEIIVSVCVAFLLTLPFYRLWRIKHAVIAALFIPVVHFTPIFICFAYEISTQTKNVQNYFGVEPFILNKFVIPLGVFIGGLCTVFLKRILNKQRQSTIVNDLES